MSHPKFPLRLMARSSLMLIAGSAIGLSACVATPTVSTGPVVRCNGKCDGTNGAPFEHRWAIDVAKVHAVSQYDESPRFVAATQQELSLPDNLWAANCVRETIVGAQRSDGTFETSPGECFAWGNTMKLNYDHSAHVDDPSHAPIINVIDGDRQIDIPGYLNIIALKNAERDQQDEVRAHLRNGDILVYFHPEDHDTTQYRMHHAAMFYDTGEGPLAIALNGVPYVHHIDNPVSYGPALNAGVESVPFHVYRFNPNGAPNVGGRDATGKFQFACNDGIRGVGGPAECQNGAATFTISDEMAEQYGYMARNWALMTNGHAPFASFHDLSWHDEGQRAALGMSLGQEIDRYAAPALAGGQIPEVYCAGLVFTNLNLAFNRPLNQAALGPDLWSTFSSGSYAFNDRYMVIGQGRNSARGNLTAADLEDVTNLPSLGRLVFEPTTASGIVDAWMDGYFPFGGLPAEQRQAVRGMVLAGAAEQISQGFTELVWAATKSPRGRERNHAVATPERVREYAAAYSQGGAALAQIKQLELANVENRYTPPPMYHWMANRPDSVLSYVGTVIHVDMLSPLGGNDGDTGGGAVTEFSEGGPDTSLYEHYYVANGGRRMQRVLNVSSGPEIAGFGTSISNRITAANIADVRIVLHPSGTWDYRSIGSSPYGCERNDNCLPGIPGILLPVPAAWSGPADDLSFTIDLFKPVAEGGAGCTIEGNVRSCPAYDYATAASSPTERINLGSARGQWVEAVIDLGQSADGVSLNNCAQCTTGGAHTNQWFIKVRDDASSEPTDPGNPTDPTDPGNPPVGTSRTFDAGAISIPIEDAVRNSMCGSRNLADERYARASVAIDEDFDMTGGEVSVTIEHSYIADLFIELRRDGRTVQVLQQCANDQGDGTLRLTARLDQALAGNARGNWEVVVSDHYPQDSGSITGFSLKLDGR